MLFRNKFGKLEELNLHDCKNDFIYYTKLKSLKYALNEKQRDETLSDIFQDKLFSSMVSLIEKSSKYK